SFCTKDAAPRTAVSRRADRSEAPCPLPEPLCPSAPQVAGAACAGLACVASIGFPRAAGGIRMRRIAAAAGAVALAAAAPGARAAEPGATPPKDATRATMGRIVDSLTFVLPLATSDARFADPSQRLAIEAALAALAEDGASLEAHGKSAD